MATGAARWLWRAMVLHNCQRALTDWCLPTKCWMPCPARWCACQRALRAGAVGSQCRNTLNGAGNRCWMARYWPRRSIGATNRGAIQSEINLAAEALVGTLASRLGNGALCFIDYGFRVASITWPSVAVARWPATISSRCTLTR